ncbi:MAG TPA: glycoside hydrolase family 11 protein [Puia sp.]
MQVNTFLWEAARKAVSRAAVVLSVAASLTISTGCKKESSPVANTVPPGVRTSGYVQDHTIPDGTGTSNGFFWSLFQQGGSANLTQGAAGNFALSYSGVTDVVGGKGFNPGSAQTIGYNVGLLNGSFNFVGIYGWTTSPLIEYYVAEMGSVATGPVINSISSDGHTYNFYRNQRISEPSIIGTATFWQYLDNYGGSSTGQNHVVTMPNHINNWKSHGGEGFGTFNYQILALEAFGGRSGNVNATVWRD